MRRTAQLLILTSLVVIATVAPAYAGPDCAATFTARETGTFYVQAGDGVMLVDLEAGDTESFWTSEPHDHWAVWTAVAIPDADPALDVVFRAVPGVLVASGQFCVTVDLAERDAPVEDDTDLILRSEAPTPVVVAAPSAPVLPAGVTPL